MGIFLVWQLFASSFKALQTVRCDLKREPHEWEWKMGEFGQEKLVCRKCDAIFGQF